MKFLIASDIHGDAVCCRAMLDAAQREGADKILLLGDVLYHGPRNDLPEGYAPRSVIEMLNGINKSSAVFDYEKLLWFNGEYIRRMTPDAFREAALPFLGEHSLSDEKLDKVLSLVQPRIEKLSEIREKIGFFLALPDYDAATLFPNKKNKVTLENAGMLLTAAKEVLASTSDFTNDALFAALGGKAEELSVKAGAILWCVRVAVSGQSVTPGGATELLEVLGQSESLARIEAALKKLSA